MAGHDDLSGETRFPAAGQEGHPDTPGDGETSLDPPPDQIPPAQASKPSTSLKELSEAGNRFVHVTDARPTEPQTASQPAADPRRAAEPSAAATPEGQPSQRSAGKPAMDPATPAQDPAGAVKAEDLLEIEPSGPEESVKEWSVAPSQVDYEGPLLTCLAMVAGLLERPISREALKAGLPHASEEFTPELAIRAADRAGLTAKVMRRPKLGHIAAVSLPCILLLEASNACVLIGFPDSNTAEIIVAEGGGSRTLPIGELEAQYTGHAIFLRPEFKFDARAADIRLSSPHRWFWGTLAQFWPIYSHV
ncbi:MAG: cysteine peptidase family C39 domain-containing protein, partial [Kiloniellales bacterium]